MAPARRCYTTPRQGAYKGHKFVPDGTQFIVATSIGIWLYDAQTAVEIARLNEKPRNIKTIAFSPDGKTLASGSTDGTILLWEWERLK